MPSANGNCSIRAIENIQLNPDRLALWSHKHGAVTFAQFGEMAASQQKRILSLGVNSGDFVVVMALPSPSLYATLVALMGLGCPIVFVEPWMPAAQIKDILTLCQPKLMCVDTFGMIWSLRLPQFRSLRRMRMKQEHQKSSGGDPLEMRAVDPSQPAIVSFTSGTTGRPKGVVRTHEYLWNLHEILVKYGENENLDGPDLTIFPNLVLFNIGNGRGSLLVPANWSLDALQRVSELKKELWPQSLSCGPAFLKRLIDYNLQPATLKSVHVGGALVECELLETTLKLLPRAHIKQVYGGTEVEPVSFIDAQVSLENSRRKGYVHSLNVGFPISEITPKWDENGTLWVSGPNVCPEYLGDALANQKNKKRDDSGVLWHCMGDRILLDENGFWYAGRADQSLEDFLLEQKLYARLGHSRAFVHRDMQRNEIVIADDSRRHVSQIVQELAGRPIAIWSGVIVRDRRHRARIDRMRTWQRSLRMNRWWIYLKERSPLMILVLLSAGPLVSGFFLSQVHGLCSDLPRGVCLQQSPRLSVVALSLMVSVLFMVLARMMDELKDFEKDKIANPGRPLPRGLISPQEMNRGIISASIVLLLLSLSFFLIASPLSALLMVFSAVYLWLMYKEFYVGAWLSEYPFWYAMSHQAVGLPLYLFGVTVFAPMFVQEEIAWLYTGANVAVSVSYEFTRKLKPDAHPAAKTYRQIYGLKKSALIAIFFQLLAVMSSALILKAGFAGVAVLLVFQFIFSAVLLYQCFTDSLHKVSEGIAALVVLMCAWMGIFVIFRF